MIVFVAIAAVRSDIDRINPRGNVHLTFKRFHHAATATGRLTTEAGSGTWHSPTMECAGSWHARRRSDRTCGAAV
jgi:hypothetical protein